MKLLRAICAAALLLPALSSCRALVTGLAVGAAEEPYRKAMVAGRMSPAEYLREKDQIHQAAYPSK